MRAATVQEVPDLTAGIKCDQDDCPVPCTQHTHKHIHTYGVGDREGDCWCGQACGEIESDEHPPELLTGQVLLHTPSPLHTPTLRHHPPKLLTAHVRAHTPTLASARHSSTHATYSSSHIRYGYCCVHIRHLLCTSRSSTITSLLPSSLL